MGGEGTRLRPLTYKIPKPLIPVQGKTLTEHVLDILKKYQIREVILSVAYKKDMIKNYFGNGEKFGVDISYIEEPEPLGTAGPLIIMNNQKKQLKERFFVINGDNLFDIDFSEMLRFHINHKAMATIALSMVDDQRSYGRVEMEKDKILEFKEKPKEKIAGYVNSGYYIFEPKVFDIVKNKERAMIETDIFPILAKKGVLYGFKSNGLWFDTGTPERYEKVKKEWKLR